MLFTFPFLVPSSLFPHFPFPLFVPNSPLSIFTHLKSIYILHIKKKWSCNCFLPLSMFLKSQWKENWFTKIHTVLERCWVKWCLFFESRTERNYLGPQYFTTKLSLPSIQIRAFTYKPSDQNNSPWNILWILFSKPTSTYTQH